MSTMAESSAQVSTHYVTFLLGEETYALDVGNAREIVAFTPPARLPNSPDWLRGVINLRGSVVPVVDLKLKFEMHETERTRKTCIIIVDLVLRGRSITLGVLANAVQEVFEMKASEIEPTPVLGARVATRFIRGMGRRNDKLFVILAAEKVFSEDQAGALAEAGFVGGPPAEAALAAAPPSA